MTIEVEEGCLTDGAGTNVTGCDLAALFAMLLPPHQYGCAMRDPDNVRFKPEG
jgi:hypothetical protein